MQEQEVLARRRDSQTVASVGKETKLQPQKVFAYEDAPEEDLAGPLKPVNVFAHAKLITSSSVRSVDSSRSQMQGAANHGVTSVPKTLDTLDNNLFFMTSSYSTKHRKLAKQLLGVNKSHDATGTSSTPILGQKRTFMKSLSPIFEKDDTKMASRQEVPDLTPEEHKPTLKLSSSVASLTPKKPIFKVKQLEIPKVRSRNYDFDIQKSNFLFGGFKLRQYDHRIAREPTMQKVVMRDQLLIFNDKSFSLKGYLVDELLTTTIHLHSVIPTLFRLNRMLEDIIGILDHLTKLMLYDFKDDKAMLDIEKNPVDLAVAAGLEPQDERQNFAENIKLYRQTHLYYRTCLEVFFLMCKFRHFDLVLPDFACHRLLSLCEKGRFLIGCLLQEMKTEYPKAHYQSRLKMVMNRDRRRAIVSNPEQINAAAEKLRKEDLSIKELIGDLYRIKFNKKELKTRAERLDLKHEIMVNQLAFGDPKTNSTVSSKKLAVQEAEIEHKTKLDEERVHRQEMLGLRALNTIEVIVAAKKEASESHRVGLITRAIKQLNLTAARVQQASSSIHKTNLKTKPAAPKHDGED